MRIDVIEWNRLVGGSAGEPIEWELTLDRAEWRDLFAAAVGGAIVARAASAREDPEEVAKWAYCLADAMVEERARRRP